MTPFKVALITGVTGQDGALLAEYLLSLGYAVHGVKRYSSQNNNQRIQHLIDSSDPENGPFFLHYGDLSDTTNVTAIISKVKPDEIYNLGAMSHVGVSFEVPLHTADIDGLGVLRILEAIKILDLQKKTKFYQASTSELFGNSPAPQNEQTPFHPCSPYAAAKLYAYWIVKIYRDSNQIFASNGILFNHESCTRGESFVTRKISLSIAKMGFGAQNCLFLGNLNAARDWGHAKDYVKAMHKILQLEKPDDFVLATGQSLTIRDLVKKAFLHVGVDIKFEGQDLEEVGSIESLNLTKVIRCFGEDHPFKLGQIVVRVDTKYFRAVEVEHLRGHIEKAKKILDWAPEITIDQLICEMIDHDIEEYKTAMGIGNI